MLLVGEGVTIGPLAYSFPDQTLEWNLHLTLSFSSETTLVEWNICSCLTLSQCSFVPWRFCGLCCDNLKLCVFPLAAPRACSNLMSLWSLWEEFRDLHEFHIPLEASKKDCVCIDSGSMESICVHLRLFTSNNAPFNVVYKLFLSVWNKGYWVRCYSDVCFVFLCGIWVHRF